MQGQIPDQLSEPRKSVLPSVSRLVSEKFECVRPLLPKSTGFVSLATPQWSSIAKYCPAGPTNRKEDENKPVALSVFEFDWAEDKRDMKLHEQVVSGDIAQGASTQVTKRPVAFRHNDS